MTKKIKVDELTSDVNATKAELVVDSVEETIEQKIKRLSEEYKTQMDLLKTQKKELAEKAKSLKVAEGIARKELNDKKAQERAEKIKEILTNKEDGVKENKSQRVRTLMLEGKSKDQIKEETGYENKFILDTMWRIEKSLGIR